MPNSTFDEFIKERTVRDADVDDAPDWDKVREDWLGSLSKLYADMEQYLKPYIDSGTIHVERTKVRLTEEYLGTYDAESLTFAIGQDRVVARPIGSLLIGADGRVDLSGTRQTLRIVHVGKRGPAFKISIAHGGVVDEHESPMRHGVDEAGWYIASRTPSIEMTPLGEDSFRDAIMAVTGG